MGTSSRHSRYLRRRLDPPRSIRWRALTEACGRWRRGGAAQSGAALAFHASCALGCGLLAGVAMLALALKSSGIDAMASGLAGVIGQDAAAVLVATLLAATHPSHAALAAGLGALGLLAASVCAFFQLRCALNRIQVTRSVPVASPAPVAGFVLVLAAGGLLLAALVIGTALWLVAALHGPGMGVAPELAGVVDAGLSALLLLPALAALLRWLPDTPPAAGEAWTGALVAGAPVVLGKVLLAGWIAGVGFGSAYGAAGAVLLTMLWLYGSALLLLFGAALAARDEAQQLDLRHAGARPLRAIPERVAANAPIPAAPPTSLATARERLRPPIAPRRADERRHAPGVLLQFPAARRSAPPPS